MTIFPAPQRKVAASRRVASRRVAGIPDAAPTTSTSLASSPAAA